jgi:polysaccharide export outer membrane protein
MFRAFLLLSVFFVSGCGAIYISPDVEADGVEVVPLTLQTVSTANSSPYTPKTLPSVFFQNAGAGGAIRGAGVVPDPVSELQRRPAALETRIPPSRPVEPYQIGVGDVILLATKSGSNTVAELSGLLAAQNSRQGYTVQDDGAIAVPDVGRIRIAGLTLEQAEAALFQALIENQIDPSFSLEIAEFNSQRVSVGGAVAKPAIVPISLTGLPLDEALLGAGGPLRTDVDFTTIRLYRDGTLYQIPLSEYLRRGDLQKIQLLAGDSIFVDTEFELAKAQAYFTEQITLGEFRQRARTQALSELTTEISLRRAALEEQRSNFRARLEFGAVDRDYVYLTGEVSKPGRFTLPFGRKATLADALFSEGGFNTQTGDPSQIYVLRGIAGTDVVTAWHLDAQSVVNLVTATRMEMRSNDIVFIAEQPVTRWNRVVQQIVPSLITAGATALAQ